MEDALRGIHAGEPCTDMLSALGALLRRVRSVVGEETFHEHGCHWFDIVRDQLLDDLPQPRKRVLAKQPE